MLLHARVSAMRPSRRRIVPNAARAVARADWQSVGLIPASLWAIRSIEKSIFSSADRKSMSTSSVVGVFIFPPAGISLRSRRENDNGGGYRTLLVVLETSGGAASFAWL